MLKYNIEKCSKLLTFNPKQHSEDTSKASQANITVDTPIRSIKVQKKKVLISANRINISTSQSHEADQSVCSVLCSRNRLYGHINKENVGHPVNHKLENSCDWVESINDYHFYLETSRQGSSSRRIGYSGKRIHEQQSIGDLLRQYQLQAKRIAEGTKLLIRIFAKSAFKWIRQSIASQQSPAQYQSRKMHRLFIVARNYHTRKPFYQILRTQSNDRSKKLTRMFKLFARYAGRQFIGRIKSKCNILIDEEIHKISQFLQEKQRQLIMSQKKVAVRMLYNTLRNAYNKRQRIAKYVTHLLRQFQPNIVKPETSRFASGLPKQMNTMSVNYTNGHHKSYSFSRIVAEQ